ncbi:hypothetical protein, partial [Cellulomonas shaoxiangyii]
MSHVTPTPEQPAVPAGLRTLIYYVALTVGFLGLLASGLVAIYLPEQAENTGQAVGVINGALLFLTGALGVA